MLVLIYSLSLIKEVAIDGLSPENIKVLKSYTKGHCPRNFVEVMSYEGRCVAGLGTINNPMQRRG
jgi:hypothetical protein